MEECGKEMNCDKGITVLMWQIYKRLNWGRQHVLDVYGMTISQMEILGTICWINEKEGNQEVTQIMVSKKSFIDPMTTSTIIRNLEKKELLSRRPSKTDSRALCVEITEKGKDLFFKIIKDMAAYDEIIYAGMDKESFIAQLNILLENIKNIKSYK